MLYHLSYGHQVTASLHNSQNHPICAVRVPLGINMYMYTYTMYMYILPSKLHVCFFPSPSLPTLHMSSILLICVAVICRALACSLSDACFASQFRKQRSWISGIQEVGFLGGREGGRQGGRKKEMKEKKYAEIREREKYRCTRTLYSLLSLPPSLPPSLPTSPCPSDCSAGCRDGGTAAPRRSHSWLE